MDRHPVAARAVATLQAMQGELGDIEARMIADRFAGRGECLAMPHATIALTLGIRHAAGIWAGRGGYALVPALAPAATMHAIQWAGLTPLLCDVDPADWSAAAEAEARAFERHGDRIAVVVPVATFGAAIDLARYEGLAQRGVGVVVDATEALGALDAAGRPFGTGARVPLVFALDALDLFGAGRGGLIYSGDAAGMAELRRLSHLAGEGPPAQVDRAPIGERVAARLRALELEAATRWQRETAYRDRLGSFDAADGFVFQARPSGSRPFLPHASVLLPRAFAGHRATILAELEALGLAARHPLGAHPGKRPWFQEYGGSDPLPVCEEVAARLIALPLEAADAPDRVDQVCAALFDACARAGRACLGPERRGRHVHRAILLGAGAAGAALLDAAAEAGALPGLAVVARDARAEGGDAGLVAVRDEALDARRSQDGEWRLRVRNPVTGRERVMRGQALVLAMGGGQPDPVLRAERVAGALLGDLAGDRLIAAEDLRTTGGMDQLRARLIGIAAPRVAILGLGAEALPLADQVLAAMPSLPIALALYHRHPIDPGAVPRDRRVALHRLGVGDDAAARAELGVADVVIAALGDRPRMIPLFDAAGAPIPLAAALPGRHRLADEEGRVLDAGGMPVPGVFGISANWHAVEETVRTRTPAERARRIVAQLLADRARSVA